MCLLWVGVVMCWSRGGGTLRLRAGLLPGTSSSGSGRPQEEGLPVFPFLSLSLVRLPGRSCNEKARRTYGMLSGWEPCSIDATV